MTALRLQQHEEKPGGNKQSRQVATRSNAQKPEKVYRGVAILLYIVFLELLIVVAARRVTDDGDSFCWPFFISFFCVTFLALTWEDTSLALVFLLPCGSKAIYDLLYMIGFVGLLSSHQSTTDEVLGSIWWYVGVEPSKNILHCSNNTVESTGAFIARLDNDKKSDALSGAQTLFACLFLGKLFKLFVFGKCWTHYWHKTCTEERDVVKKVPSSVPGIENRAGKQISKWRAAEWP